MIRRLRCPGTDRDMLGVHGMQMRRCLEQWFHCGTHPFLMIWTTRSISSLSTVSPWPRRCLSVLCGTPAPWLQWQNMFQRKCANIWKASPLELCGFCGRWSWCHGFNSWMSRKGVINDINVGTCNHMLIRFWFETHKFDRLATSGNAAVQHCCLEKLKIYENSVTSATAFCHGCRRCPQNQQQQALFEIRHV